ncbi:MAG: ABC transporter ATP-binding protein [Deltaproteobacteria bacterium GWC2_65_14]|nr:MAG: ABC transporter ATP-binding protein [Deltaproteobacteria bacterium GWC2_65_14]
MLRVESAVKSFDGFRAVNGANLDVEAGEIVAVIGPNGAGKTTLFHLITGHLSADSGRILFQGREIGGVAPHLLCRMGITRSFQVVNIFPRLSVFENVQIAVLARERKTFRIFATVRDMAAEEVHGILRNVGLYEKRDVESDLLSHGDQKVLEIAVALSGKPELLILDEPTAGMAPEETKRCIHLIRRLSEEHGLTILFCEHDLAVVFEIANRIMVMVRGGTVIQGSCEEVRRNREVQSAYLGEDG